MAAPGSPSTRACPAREGGTARSSGPTTTATSSSFPLFGDSAAVDAGSCLQTVDGRFLPRVGPACDLGAFELTLQARNLRDDGDGIMGPPSPILRYGGARVPIDQIPGSVLSRPVGQRQPRPSGLHPERRLRGIDLEQTGLAAVPLRSIPLRSIALDAEILDSISLDQLPLTYTGANGEGWNAYLLDHGLTELASQPHNTVTLGQVLAETNGDGIELAQIDFSATPLGSLPVGAIAMGTAPLSELELPAGTDWCTLIAAYSDKSCGPAGSDIDLSTASLVSISLQGVPLRSIPLRSIPLRSIDFEALPLRSIPLRSIPLRSIDIQASPLRSIPLRSILIEASPLRSIPLRSIDIQASPLRSIPLRSINIQASPLRSIPLRSINIQASPLRSIPLRSIANVANVVNCSVFLDCASQTLTLGDVPLAALIGDLGALVSAIPTHIDLGSLGELGGPDHPDAYGAADAPALATLGELVDFVGDTTLGDIGGPEHPDAYGTTTIDDFLALLIELFPDVTLGDLLSGILPPSELPWQDIDLAGGVDALKEAAGGSDRNDAYVLYEFTIDQTLTEGSAMEVDLSVPDGYTLLPSSFEMKAMPTGPIDNVAPFDHPPVIIGPDPGRPGRTLANVRIGPPLGSSRLQFRAIPPLELGTAGPFEVELTPDDGFWRLGTHQTQGIDVTITDLLEDNDTVEVATHFAPTDDNGEPMNEVDDVLFLTHLASATDVDWFRIPVAQGEQLSVYLSNLPADYDLLLYGPAKAPLRGTPSRVLPPSPDGGWSLLGEENAANALVAADIATTPPSDDWELYGVSSRRGTTSERIDTGALPAGDYAVKVVGYNGATERVPVHPARAADPGGWCRHMCGHPGGRADDVDVAVGDHDGH